MTTCTLTPIVGYPKLNEWAGVAQNRSQTLVVALSITGPTAGNVGKDLLDQLKAFEPQDAQELHQGLLDMLTQIRQAGCSMQFAGGLLSASQIVFVNFGGLVTLIKPQGVKPLLQATDQLQMVEGKRGNYTVVLGTQVGQEYFEEVTYRLSHGQSLTAVTSALTSALQTHTTPVQLALALWECTALELPSHLLAHGSAHTLQKAEVIRQPTVSIESIEPVTQTAIPTSQEVGNTSRSGSRLPTPPSSAAKIIRSLVTTVKTAGQGLQNRSQTWLPQLGKSGYRLMKGAGQSITKLSRLPHTYRQADSATKTKLLVVAIGTGSLIAAALGYGWYKQHQTQLLNQTYQAALVAPLALKQQAVELQTSDPLSAREKIGLAVTQLQELRPQFAHNHSINTQLESEIIAAENFATEISGKQELSDLQVFFDLRLTDPTFLANGLGAVEQKLYFVDKEKHQVVELDSRTKQFQLTTYSPERTATDWTILGKTMYLLGDGLQALPVASAELKKLKDPGDSDQDATLIRQFESFLYVFNPVKRNIYRFTLEKSGLSEGIGWITNKKDLDFSSVQDMAVDGSVWLTTKVGEIKKYTQGQPQAFTLSGIEEPFNSPLLISTTANQNFLFILEPNQNRVVILSKTGALIRQIKSPALGAATDLVATDNPNILYVLSGSTVYSIPLE